MVKKGEYKGRSYASSSPKKKKVRNKKSRKRIAKTDVIGSERATVAVKISDLDGTKIYTDGACTQSNPSNGLDKWVGGFGYCCLEDGTFYESMSYRKTTNNRMELKAIIHALENIEVGGHYNIISDSQYCIRSINEWLNGWVRRGILHTKANTGLWNRFITARDKHKSGGSKISYYWVKGHVGIAGNEEADALAVNGQQSNIQDVCTDTN